eukprot:CAMPEP_0201120386 /NCGR_PEP_ID=MMETSP0850-20130426/4452_1 /ASSEMBLY_ACC=CAM_ASM_000622 /TAXON_ID=183588 /ORGANISM="Pseudo-nitzschia fraudulenta, Strain WWA7" /LENGTH=183 /DNA_ID=CAMNT_0047386505 /DNA_START=367 /DNA_END=915 /DNA_ORIENTATION=+
MDFVFEPEPEFVVFLFLLSFLCLGLKGFDGREAPAAAAGGPAVGSLAVTLEGPIELFHDLKAHPAHDFALGPGDLLFLSHVADLVVEGLQPGNDLLELLLVCIRVRVIAVFVVGVGLLALQGQLAEAEKMPEQLARPPEVAVEPLLEVHRQRGHHLQCVGIRLGILRHSLRQRVEELLPVARW